MVKEEWGWQGRTTELRCRAEYVFRNKAIPSDIVFRVKNKQDEMEEISAHKVLLAMGSDVFEKQLYGPNMEAMDHMTVNNHGAEVFRTVVEYLYSDRTPDLTEENAMEVLKCAEEYHIADLVGKCQVLILQDLGSSGAVNDVLFAMTKIKKTTKMENQPAKVNHNTGQQTEPVVVVGRNQLVIPIAGGPAVTTQTAADTQTAAQQTVVVVDLPIGASADPTDQEQILKNTTTVNQQIKRAVESETYAEPAAKRPTPDNGTTKPFGGLAPVRSRIFGQFGDGNQKNELRHRLKLVNWTGVSVQPAASFAGSVFPNMFPKLARSSQERSTLGSSVLGSSNQTGKDGQPVKESVRAASNAPVVEQIPEKSYRWGTFAKNEGFRHLISKAPQQKKPKPDGQSHSTSPENALIGCVTRAKAASSRNRTMSSHPETVHIDFASSQQR